MLIHQIQLVREVVVYSLLYLMFCLVWKKNVNLFGIDTASKFSRQSDYVLVVEGYFDVIALHELGIFNVVATMGTAVSQNHLMLASKLSQTGIIIMLFDDDDAGKKAIQRVANLLQRNDLSDSPSTRKKLFQLDTAVQVRVGSMRDAALYLKGILREKGSANDVLEQIDRMKDCGDLSQFPSRSDAILAVKHMVDKSTDIRSFIKQTVR
jgi:5S rRNA maturation endonuclease (ribonuclease M5)